MNKHEPTAQKQAPKPSKAPPRVIALPSGNKPKQVILATPHDAI